MRRLFVSILIAGLLSGAAADAREPAAKAEAKAALAHFKQLAKKGDNWKKLGFERPDDVDDTDVDDEIPIFMVRLDKLRGFSGDPATVVEPLDQAIVPMKHRGRVEAGFFVEKSRGTWKTRGFGRPQLVKRIEQIRKKAAREENVPEGDFFVVHVAALNAYFLGHGAGAQMRLTPLLNDKDLDFKAGETLPAAEVFNRLKPAAQQHNGDPT